ENWGAIFTFENTLLVDPAITSDATRQRIFGVAAHEMAHQWFGDLVTMAWWSELWLNEGFASWMATKATDALHPEWEAGLSRVDTREQAMSLDSVASTHPIVQDIQTVEQSNQAFDAIAYQKGEAVITMLENYVGSDVWRRGVRDYMATYKYGNTVSDNLWEKIESAAGKPIKAIARDFTDQPGIPLIRVVAADCAGGTTNVELQQGEFSRDRKDKQPLSWRVPVVAGTVGGSEQRVTVEGGSARFALQGCGPVLINKGQAGYYRTLYTPAMLDRLAKAYPGLDTIDQMGLLADNWALGLAGYQSPAGALDFVSAVPANANPQLWSQVAGMLAALHEMYSADKAHQALVARYASARLLPVLNRLGWSPKAGEKQTDALLRAALIGTLGRIGEPGVVAEAGRRFAASATDPAQLSGPLRTTILGVAARNIDAAGWERLREQARAEKSALAREQLYTFLGSAKDEALARRALDLALTDEPGLTNSSRIIAAVASAHPELAFDFALANREKVEERVDVASRTRFLSELAAGSAQPATIAKLEDYAARYLTPQSRRPADEAIAAIRARIETRQRLGDVSRWLETHVK
ncbi:MAG TPA: M1 family aminopeptidase, partial [Allosphingosinicella sp.]